MRPDIQKTTLIPLMTECREMFSNRRILIKVATPDVRPIDFGHTFQYLVQIVFATKEGFRDYMFDDRTNKCNNLHLA